MDLGVAEPVGKIQLDVKWSLRESAKVLTGGDRPRW